MLMNDFYTCQDMQQSDNEITCRLVFNADHDIFKGHFPGQPVVPGVCMMEIVKELLQDKLNTTLMLSKADNVKFLQLIIPGIEPAIKITWKDNDGGYSVNAIFKTEAASHFKLMGQYVVNDSIAQQLNDSMAQ